MAESKDAHTHPQNHRHQKLDAFFELFFQVADRTDQLIINIQKNRQRSTADARNNLRDSNDNTVRFLSV